ncbi:MAG TPA: PD-(D/E)XK nuclease family protein [Roseiflexaceae bacterium]|nr:PD-(D/E)XK nuclease family protein [Roseiflexaceae bacterium]
MLPSDTQPPAPDLTLLMAPAGGGKTAAVARLLAAPRRGLALALVSDAGQRDLLRGLVGPTRRVRVLQFEALARAVLRRAGQPQRLLDGVARRALVRRLLAEMRALGALATYARVADKPGFVAAAAALLGDLANADLTPARFADAAQTPHDAELAALYARYTLFQQQHGLADLPRRLGLARDALRTGAANLAGIALLAVDGFDQFTPLQISLLVALARHVPVTLTLTAADPPRAAHRRFNRTLDELRAAFRTREQWLPPAPASRAPALRHIEQRLFDLDDPPSVPADGAVALVEAADREREVRAALRHIRTLLDGGADPSDLALLYRDGAPYSALLAEVAAEYGLALDLAEGLPLVAAPPVAALLALLRLHALDYPRRALLQALRNPYIALQETANPAQETSDPAQATHHTTRNTQHSALLAGELDAVARACGVADGLGRWRAALERLAAEPDAPAPAEGTAPTGQAAAALREQFDRLVARLAPPPEASATEYLGWVRGLLARQEEVWLRLPEAEQAEGEPAEPFAARDREALAQLDALLLRQARAAELLGDASTPFGVFLADLEEALGTARYQPEPPGGVAALPVLLARGRSFAHVCLLGLSEGEFPLPLAEPPIYRRAERRAMRARGLALPAPDPADERSLFYEAVTRARDTLMLTRTRLDETGAPLERSPYLRALLDLLDGVPVRRIAAGSLPEPAEAASPDEYAQSLVGAGAEEESEADDTPDDPAGQGGPGLPAAWPHILRALAVERQRLAPGPFGPHEGLIGDPDLAALVAAHFGPRHQWSITQLNDYITCPFRFAAAHGLRLRSRHDPEDELDSARRGQLFHAILARAGESWRAAGLRLGAEQADQALALLDSATTEVLDEAPREQGFAPSPFWAWERDEVRRRLQAALRGFLRIAGGAQPVGFELDFGGGSGRPPLRVATPAGPTLIQGRVDRIDRRDDGTLAVVDYKSGGSPRPLGDSLEGYDVQLAIYALAAAQADPTGDNQPVTRAAFLHVGSGRASPALEGQQLQTAQAAARARIAEVTTAVRQADFRVAPRDTCPDYCEFVAICRRNLGKAKGNA